MESEPIETAYFCPGCSTCFAVLGSTGVCPKCGMWLVEDGYVSPGDPTILLQFLPDAGTSGQSRLETNDAQSLERLIGSNLHVYEVDSLLGRGGMGWVFLATHRDLKRPCALKILAPHAVCKEVDYLQRFEEEGRNAAALVHPNIVTTHAIGRHDDLHFLEMEFVPGRSLSDSIQAKNLTPLRSLTIAAGIAAGLGTAHLQGIVHRDLKPDNVLLTHQGVPKISDFGLAKRIGTGRVSEAGIPPRFLAGTPQYMAPELFHGADPSPASDVYALGVTLFQMLTGELPFLKPKLSELIATVTHDELPDLRRMVPGLPLDVAEVVYAMLSRSPSNRPTDGIMATQYLLAVLGHSRDFREMIREALDGDRNVTWVADGSRFVVDVALPDNRRQRVFLDAQDDGGLDRVVSIYSLCGLANSQLFGEALRLNSQHLHGALALRQIDGEEHLIMVNSYPRATVDAGEIRQSVHEIARNADAFERRLHPTDRH
ncbi:MAG: protein kinase [Planctomycetaceae bacterium]